MNSYSGLYDCFAKLLSYPDKDTKSVAETCQRLLSDSDDAAENSFNRFFESINGLSVETLQERYVETFDINPVCALEVGWGEQYNRGEFLTKVRVDLRQNGISEMQELPDHLIHMLPLLGRVESDLSDEYCTDYVLPAVKKMCYGFKDKEILFYAFMVVLNKTLSLQCSQTSDGVKNA